jgi:TonB family protein
MSILLIVAAAAAVAHPNGVATDATESAALIAAKAARTRVRETPVWKSGPKEVTPPAARAIGAHGTVKVAGILETDGRFGDLRVVYSGKSDILDAEALRIAGLSVFTPAKDASGVPLALYVAMPVRFEKYAGGKKGGYSCRQFVLDNDWWTKTWGENVKSDYYLMMSGFSFAGAYLRGNKTSVTDDFDERWSSAVKNCRSNPESNVVLAL